MTNMEKLKVQFCERRPGDYWVALFGSFFCCLIAFPILIENGSGPFYWFWVAEFMVFVFSYPVCLALAGSGRASDFSHQRRGIEKRAYSKAFESTDSPNDFSREYTRLCEESAAFYLRDRSSPTNGTGGEG